MSLDNNCTISKMGNSYILYDANIITEPTVELFNCDYHTNQANQQNNLVSNSSSDKKSGIGRAPVVYFSQAGKSLVLKHYYRGGAVASILKDRYFGFSIIKSRAFREFRLLKKMAELGLPVPVAVAAHVNKSLFSYRADLITEELKQTETVSDVLSNRVLGIDGWRDIGRCVKRFHQHDIYHADLNARNILLATSGEFFLIDFDNSYIRISSDSASAVWKMANLARLKRSLLKFKRQQENFNFDESNWSELLAGYDE